MNDYFDFSSYDTSHETLHHYSNQSSGNVPIKYYVKSALEEEEYYLNKHII